jgi:hypothetical protein
MSIALPACRCEPAAWGGRVRRSTERPLSAFPIIVEFAAAPVAILAPSATELPEKSTLFSFMDGKETLAFREHDGLSRRLMGEAERR